MRQFQDQQVIPGTPYRVRELIGSGGMGSVYDVEHEELGKRFVLKALHRGLTDRNDLVARLRNEWRALGRLEHPNIVTVTDAGTTTDGVAFYVMERLEGETLAARLRRHHELPIHQTVQIGIGIVEGLGAAHAIGIIHRDVKPPNIFLTRDGNVKLLDFGIAKVIDHSGTPITGRGIAIGTPRYMSPEQARGARVDGRADLYAVGLLLFEMASGRLPFEDALDPNDLLLAHLTTRPSRLSSAAFGVPPELDELVASLLAKDARERPLQANLVAQALRKIAGQVGLASHPASGLTGESPAKATARWGAYPSEASTMQAAPLTSLGRARAESEHFGTSSSAEPRLVLGDASPVTNLDPCTDVDPNTDMDPSRHADPASSVEHHATRTPAPSTLRLDESGAPDELATRTAVRLDADAVHLTPPPVTSMATATVRPPSWLLLVAAAVVCAAAAFGAWALMGSGPGSAAVSKDGSDAPGQRDLQGAQVGSPSFGIDDRSDLRGSRAEPTGLQGSLPEGPKGPTPESSSTAPRARRLPSSGL